MGAEPAWALSPQASAKLPEQREELQSHDVLDGRGLMRPLGAEDVAQALGLSVDTACTARPPERGTEPDRGEPGGPGRGRCHRRHRSGIGAGQTALLVLEGYGSDWKQS